MLHEGAKGTGGPYRCRGRECREWEGVGANRRSSEKGGSSVEGCIYVEQRRGCIYVDVYMWSIYVE